MADWREITKRIGDYIYTGDMNPVDHSGAWINHKTGHVVRLEGFDLELTDAKGRPVCLVESLELLQATPKRIKESLSCIGVNVSEWLKMPKDERRACLGYAALAYGYYEPATEWPHHHTVQTHRENAAFRAVNNFIR